MCGISGLVCRNPKRPVEQAVLERMNAAGSADHGKRLWALLNLEIWLQKYAC